MGKIIVFGTGKYGKEAYDFLETIMFYVLQTIMRH